MNGGRSVATRIDRLCAIDHHILGLLQVHRVLTTPQLITLTERPERTIDYRLTRLRERSLVDRTRPYAASGSAPFSWWLTRAGTCLVEGSSPAPGKGPPNPLFLRHTTAIAGLFVALCDIGPSVGLTVSEWRRDEDAWEDWSSYRGTGRIRPDAYAEVHLDVDGKDGVAGAFVEVDFATMDQVPHTRGTTRAASPAIREVLGSGLGSRSRTRENPARGSITIREAAYRDSGGRSRSRDSPHRGPTTTSRMAECTSGAVRRRAATLRPGARRPRPGGALGGPCSPGRSEVSWTARQRRWPVRCVIYLRVSTKEQAEKDLTEEGFSIAA